MKTIGAANWPLAVVVMGSVVLSAGSAVAQSCVDSCRTRCAIDCPAPPGPRGLPVGPAPARTVTTRWEGPEASARNAYSSTKTEAIRSAQYAAKSKSESDCYSKGGRPEGFQPSAGYYLGSDYDGDGCREKSDGTWVCEARGRALCVKEERNPEYDAWEADKRRQEQATRSAEAAESQYSMCMARREQCLSSCQQSCGVGSSGQSGGSSQGGAASGSQSPPSSSSSAGGSGGGSSGRAIYDAARSADVSAPSDISASNANEDSGSTTGKAVTAGAGAAGAAGAGGLGLLSSATAAVEGLLLGVGGSAESIAVIVLGGFFAGLSVVSVAAMVQRIFFPYASWAGGGMFAQIIGGLTMILAGIPLFWVVSGAIAPDYFDWAFNDFPPTARITLIVASAGAVAIGLTTLVVGFVPFEDIFDYEKPVEDEATAQLGSGQRGIAAMGVAYPLME